MVWFRKFSYNQYSLSSKILHQIAFTTTFTQTDTHTHPSPAYSINCCLTTACYDWLWHTSYTQPTHTPTPPWPPLATVVSQQHVTTGSGTPHLTPCHLVHLEKLKLSDLHMNLMMENTMADLKRKSSSHCHPGVDSGERGTRWWGIIRVT